ncbi:DUF2235 domain-containing protein [Rhizobium leguminosarum]|uniref:DUF2235 domain-containing protein n=1 Tax=Rhizobium leguminosarum TaxID=384 RepID=UPI003F9B8644
MARNIYVLLDGTWNDAEAVGKQTNIYRLRQLILAGYREQGKEPTKDDLQDTSRPDVLFYERGVGTGFLDRFRGGAFGIGLARNIRRAYRFLSEHYTPGDSVFIFGFSRGAFTARSLIGMIGAAGLLERTNCSPNLEAAVWDYYRTHPHDRQPAARDLLQRYVLKESDFKVSCLGLFDTVGALGIPVRQLWRFNRDLYQFHNVDLSPLVSVALHALAIDEHREAFEPSIWRNLILPLRAGHVEQTWFAGSHSDVGGGNIDTSKKKHPEAEDISLDWMIRRVKAFNPQFKARILIAGKHDFDARELALRNARAGFYCLFSKALRTIGGANIAKRWREHGVGGDHPEPSYGESIHVSALELLGRPVTWNGRVISYNPRNLIAALDSVEAAYSSKEEGFPSPSISDWDGAWVSDSSKAKELITEARARLDAATSLTTGEHLIGK